MHSKLLGYLLSPAMEFCGQYIVTIDGVEYIPADSFGEVLSEMIYLLVDVMNQIKAIISLEVFSFALLFVAAIFLVKCFYCRCKEKKSSIV